MAFPSLLGKLCKVDASVNYWHACAWVDHTVETGAWMDSVEVDSVQEWYVVMYRTFVTYPRYSTDSHLESSINSLSSFVFTQKAFLSL